MANNHQKKNPVARNWTGKRLARVRSAIADSRCRRRFPLVAGVPRSSSAGGCGSAPHRDENALWDTPVNVLGTMSRRRATTPPAWADEFESARCPAQVLQVQHRPDEQVENAKTLLCANQSRPDHRF